MLLSTSSLLLIFQSGNVLCDLFYLLVRKLLPLNWHRAVLGVEYSASDSNVSLAQQHGCIGMNVCLGVSRSLNIILLKLALMEMALNSWKNL